MRIAISMICLLLMISIYINNLDISQKLVDDEIEHETEMLARNNICVVERLLVESINTANYIKRLTTVWKPCGFRPRFCSSIEMRSFLIPSVVTIVRPVNVTKCCPGHFSPNGLSSEFPSCQPKCIPHCYNGTCTDVNKCSCYMGYSGESCDLESSIYEDMDAEEDSEEVQNNDINDNLYLILEKPTTKVVPTEFPKVSFKNLIWNAAGEDDSRKSLVRTKRIDTEFIESTSCTMMNVTCVNSTKHKSRPKRSAMDSELDVVTDSQTTDKTPTDSMPASDINGTLAPSQTSITDETTTNFVSVREVPAAAATVVSSTEESTGGIDESLAGTSMTSSTLEAGDFQVTLIPDDLITTSVLENFLATTSMPDVLKATEELENLPTTSMPDTLKITEEVVVVPSTSMPDALNTTEALEEWTTTILPHGSNTTFKSDMIEIGASNASATNTSDESVTGKVGETAKVPDHHNDTVTETVKEIYEPFCQDCLFWFGIFILAVVLIVAMTVIVYYKAWKLHGLQYFAALEDMRCAFFGTKNEMTNMNVGPNGPEYLERDDSFMRPRGPRVWSATETANNHLPSPSTTNPLSSFRPTSESASVSLYDDLPEIASFSPFPPSQNFTASYAATACASFVSTNGEQATSMSAIASFPHYAYEKHFIHFNRPKSVASGRIAPQNSISAETVDDDYERVTPAMSVASSVFDISREMDSLSIDIPDFDNPNIEVLSVDTSEHSMNIFDEVIAGPVFDQDFDSDSEIEYLV